MYIPLCTVHCQKMIFSFWSCYTIFSSLVLLDAFMISLCHWLFSSFYFFPSVGHSVSSIHAFLCNKSRRSKVSPYDLPRAFSPVWALLFSCISRAKTLLISDKAWANMSLPFLWSNLCCVKLFGWNHLQSFFLHFPLMKNLHTFRCSPLWHFFSLHPPSL